MTRPPDDAPAMDVASPACSMHEADDAYMGYAGRVELLGFLDALLQGERAVAQVALESAPAAGSGPVAARLSAAAREASRWCATLVRHVQAPDEAPSPRTGTLHAEAMAIADLARRLAFLERRQASAVRTLRAMLPRVRDDRLHADLARMLRGPEAEISAGGGRRGVRDGEEAPGR
ncbi:MAG: hypothetical protein IT561_19405 [Alphaproteobacteria bacterium]|nr:hypothetical protein [Alphaproteobacteria bacterium]